MWMESKSSVKTNISFVLPPRLDLHGGDFYLCHYIIATILWYVWIRLDENRSRELCDKPSDHDLRVWMLLCVCKTLRTRERVFQDTEIKSSIADKTWLGGLGWYVCVLSFEAWIVFWNVGGWVKRTLSIVPQIVLFWPGDKLLDQGSLWDESSSGLMIEKVNCSKHDSPTAKK